MNVRDVAFTVIDVIATHNLVDYIKPGEDRARILSGVTLGALGYSLGPTIEERLQTRNNNLLDLEVAREDLIYSLGGAVLGATMGYVAGESFIPQGEGSISNRIRQFVREDEEPKRPGGLITVASAGYLGYSLLVAEHSDDFKQRQRWGLGAAALGYLMGPEAISKFKDTLIPADAADNGVEVYRRGGAVIGGLIGGGAGYYLGRNRRTQ